VIRVQILTLEQTTRTDAQRELLTVLARLSELGEKESALIDKQSRLDIRAPVAGKVHELNIHTVGGIAASGDQLAVIVPYKDSLAIELRIPPTEIDRIHLDQGVRLRFTSFNQRTTPELDGRITYIAADISHDPKAKQDFYPVRALLENDEMRSIAGRPILPGMPTEAYIITEKRSALSYFLKPITDQVSRTFREP
jgi:HlyD family secretion protein